jgi:hypothetical protein
MPGDLEKQLHYDTRLESYKTIFNHAWAQELSALTAGTKLDPVAFALCANWRSAANTHIFPWLVVNSLHSFWEDYAQHSGFTPAFVGAMGVEIPKRMGTTPITAVQKRGFRQAINGFAQQIHQTLKDSPPPDMSCDAIWREFTSHYEFILAIWGSQQLIYSSLFFAYENFVSDAIAIAAREPDYRAYRFSQLVSDAKKHFGDDIAKQILEGQFIEITRLARNCLAHRGGRESQELKDTKHRITVNSEGIIQIEAPDNANCIRELEKRAMILAKAAVAMPEFKLKSAGE